MLKKLKEVTKIRKIHIKFALSEFINQEDGG
jgi:hypothetical protein